MKDKSETEFGNKFTLSSSSFHSSFSDDNWSIDDTWSWYTDYLKGDLGTITIAAGKKTSSNLLYTPSQSLICPSAQRTNYFWQTYLFWPGSANDQKLSISILTKAAQKSGAYLKPNGTFALWTDSSRYFLDNQSAASSMNHKKGGIQAGGNVGYNDGSVKWHPWVEYGQHGGSDYYFTRWGGTNISAPSNMIALAIESDGNINTGANNVRWATWSTSASSLFK